MSERELACVILAAGKGTRLKSKLPKVLHPVAGLPMIAHVADVVDALAPQRTIIVVGPDMETVAAAVDTWDVAVQEQQCGTADAVRAAAGHLSGFEGDVLVVFGDTPLITVETLQRMIERRREADDPAVVVLGMRPDDPAQYGRLVVDGEGSLEAIVEFADAGPEQKSVRLCNGGLMAFNGRLLPELLAGIEDGNAQGEFYLTDAVAVARSLGHVCAFVEGSAIEVHGINSRAELAMAEAYMQDRLRAAAMAGGATLVDPGSVFLASDTVLGRDVTIGPSVVFGPGVIVEDDVEIRAFCHIEGAVVGSGAIIGPFARLRPGAEIGTGARVGNFVEIKNATLGTGAKANHLSYLGDAGIGAGANIGAGTITCNYDGYLKHRTEIGEGAFIGSNTALAAPVRVGDRANVGAGSVIVRDVPDDALAVARGEQVEKPGAAKRYRARKAAEKADRSK